MSPRQPLCKEMRDAPWSAEAKLPPWHPEEQAVAVRRLTDTALQGAFGTIILMAVKNVALLTSQRVESRKALYSSTFDS
jgi:hypothetical protein